jgi:glycosyltransferase involved in cell wall biosynthesis
MNSITADASDPNMRAEAARTVGHPAPLVSVAIITYSQRQFLEECINSVLIQDYQPIEIVVADDGSSDGTHELLREFDRRNPGKFRLLLSEHNRGITHNSNAAHFACRGKYIAWMGGDDLMLPGKITAQVKLMEANPECSICHHDLDVFDSQSGRSLRLYSSGHSVRRGGIQEAIRYGTFNGACSSMVRASCTPKGGFDTNIPVASDWLYWIDTLAGGGTIEYIDRVLGRYRRHVGNVTHAAIDRPSQAQLDHIMTCFLLWHRYPTYRRQIRQVYANHLWRQRRGMPGLRWGWSSVCADVRIDRLLKLLVTDPIRARL